VNKPHLTIHLFGPFEASLDNHPVQFRFDKIRALLAYLLVEANLSHRRESLATLLWGEQPEVIARTNLRQALLQLKKSLAPLLAVDSAAPPFLEVTPKTVRLNLEPQRCQVDVVNFAARQAGCSRHPDLVSARCSACLDQLRQAVALYRGDFLTGLTLPDAPAFDEWRVQRQEQWHRQVVAALETLIQGSLARPDYPQAETYLRRLLTFEPWRETAHRQLIQLLALAGRRTAALAHFELCRRVLRAELGVEPAAETLALAEQIRQGGLGDWEIGRLETIFNLQPSPGPTKMGNLPLARPERATFQHDWGDAPEVSHFYGREVEMAQLTQWLTVDGCRLVAVLGMGGIGKTALAARAAKKLAAQFEVIFWRSLLNAPALSQVLRACLQFLSQQTLVDWPDSLDEQLELLFDQLRRRRCLLILDNMESLLQSGRAGYFKPGYEAYDQLLRRVGQTEHRSCLLLTSRERPLRLAGLEGETLLARSLPLAGLEVQAGQKIVKSSRQSAKTLVQRYSGNPLALKLAARAIQELFEGDSEAFLSHETIIFDDIRAVLEQQFKRLSPLERELLLWLAVERESVSLQALADNLVRPVSKRAVLEALHSLRRRSLLEQRPGDNPTFNLSNVVIEYLTDYLIEQVTQELTLEQIDLFNRQALLKAEAKDYVRQSQTRLIIQPIVDALVAGWGIAGAEAKLRCLLEKWRANMPPKPGYAAGNLLNLLRQMGADCTGSDFSGLTVWQAYLRDMSLPRVNFAGADLAHSVFTDTFGVIHAVTFSPDGQWLAASAENGDIYLWRLRGGQLDQIYTGHTDVVEGLAFSPDGCLLASGSDDGTVCIWQLQTGQRRYRLKHPDAAGGVAFSPDGAWLASGGMDGIVRLWDVETGQLQRSLTGHTGRVASVAFSPDGQIIASGSFDQTVRLWEAGTGQLRHTLIGHTFMVSAVAFSPDGQTLASASADQTIRLWDVQTAQAQSHHLEHAHAIWSIAFSPDGQSVACGSFGQSICLWDIRTEQTRHFLHEQNAMAWRVAFSPDGQTLASGSADQTIQLWEVRQGQLYQTLQGHTGGVMALALSADGQTVVSGHADQQVRCWHTPTGQCYQTWRSHSRMVMAVAVSADGQTVASGSTDRTLCVWHKGCLRYTLRGHQAPIWSIALSPDGQTLASAGEDQTVRLWEIETGRCTNILHGHTHLVLAVAFSPDGQTLVSGGFDQTICIWNVQTGVARQVWQSQDGAVSALAFSPDGRRLASAGGVKTVSIWDVAQGQIIHTLQGHTNRLWAVAFSADGRLLASGGDDQIIRLWDVAKGELIRTLPGHTNRVWGVHFSPASPTLVSGSADGAIKVWDIYTGACLHTWRSEGPYAGMNITGVTGLTAAQKVALKALGAMETALAF
jgi:WD40 repeat protein/DNA-binding SARP family transcriptional activator